MKGGCAYLLNRITGRVRVAGNSGSQPVSPQSMRRAGEAGREGPVEADKSLVDELHDLPGIENVLHGWDGFNFFSPPLLAADIGLSLPHRFFEG